MRYKAQQHRGPASTADAEAEPYTLTARVLHWLVAAAVFGQISLGAWMIGIPKSPPGVRVWWFNLHKSIGITLGLIILVRLLWRWTHRVPPLPETVPAWQRVSAKISHFLLYACMVVMPVSGYLGSSFTKFPIVYWGYKLPNWGWESPALKDLMSQIHLCTVIVFGTLIAIHICGALKHLLINRDGVFQRMWFGQREEPLPDTNFTEARS
jgi:cytochrome b561